MKKILTTLAITATMLSISTTQAYAAGGYGHDPEDTAIVFDNTLFVVAATVLFISGFFLLSSTLSIKSKMAQ